jgi:hypothetical protein
VGADTLVQKNEREVDMRVSKISGAVLASVVLTVSFGLSACSSGSSAGGSSAGEASAGASTDAGASASPDTGRPPVTAATACAQVETDSAGYMKGFASTTSTDWNTFAEDVLGLSSDTTDAALQGALMNVAVAAQFTVTGLDSGDDLTTAKGDFDTTMSDLNKLCVAAGAPLTLAAGGAASSVASAAPSASAS